MSKDINKPAQPTFDTIGKPVSKIPIELSTRFLEHFSEQLYSSPQKAFEELISNGWDAGADIVDVHISTNLNDPGATMAVLDNGASMDEDGLRTLWHIASSPKRDFPNQHGRRIIGKFGIGKLATYVLATKLTYICKAEDGKIRRVTMDYGDIDNQDTTNTDRLINDLELEVFEVNESDISNALTSVHGGKEILDRIENNFQKNIKPGEDQESTVDIFHTEFGGAPDKLEKPQKGTWTLVVLSALKQTGRELKLGILRRMLAAALPFSSEMMIHLNGELLKSPKLEYTPIREWKIGPDLEIADIELYEDDNVGIEDEDVISNSMQSMPENAEKPKPQRIKVTSGSEPYAYIDIPKIGRVTGLVRIFHEKISGGKSEMRGASNGFHVNVLGRVVNQTDPSFGEKNLSHAA